MPQGVTGIAGSTAAEAAAQRPEEKPRKRAAPSSGICAVLGPSGAGKTTLIDILAGRKRDAGALCGSSAMLEGLACTRPPAVCPHLKPRVCSGGWHSVVLAAVPGFWNMTAVRGCAFC